ncbi:NUDIX hydrolase [Candidatus Daviesbacteria bacterium]|nr:NUDIX hydrolase [Candidatus Daviesbacteria bacterium]
MIKCTFENEVNASLRHVVVHAIVEKDGRLLLERRADDLLEGGKWSLPSGFLGRDENAEEGVLRELEEETGWKGEIISLFRINTNPSRPHEDRQNVALEFIVKPLEKINKSDSESSEVEWISIDKLPQFEEFAFDHGETIRLYLKYRENPFPPPLIV